MVTVPVLVGEGVTSPPVFTVAMEVLLLLHALPTNGVTVQVDGEPPVHSAPEPVENPMADIVIPFTVTTAMNTVLGNIV